MKRIIAIIAIAAMGSAQAKDYLYAYYPHGNVEYACQKLPSYLDTEGFGTLRFKNCEVISIDYSQWPVFPPLQVRVVAGFVDSKVGMNRTCQFVASATATVDSSVVVDCRGR